MGGKSGRAHFAWCGVKDFELTLVLTPGFWTSSLDPGVSAWAGGANPSTRVFVAWGQIWLKRHDTDQIIGFCQIWINFHSFFICQSSIQTQGKICLIFLNRRNTDMRPGQEVVGVMVKADGNSSNCNVSLLLLCRPWQWIQSSRFKFYWLIIYLASWDAIEPGLVTQSVSQIAQYAWIRGCGGGGVQPDLGNACILGVSVPATPHLLGSVNTRKNVVFDVQKKMYNLSELGGGGEM